MVLDEFFLMLLWGLTNKSLPRKIIRLMKISWQICINKQEISRKIGWIIIMLALNCTLVILTVLSDATEQVLEVDVSKAHQLFM